MHLKFSKSGKKFFFITLCTDGREKSLSRINDDATIALTPAGEAIVNEWRAQHAKNAALTASNFVIMPDHVHLLLIVDYDKSPDFDIIDWIHNFTATTASGAIFRTICSPRRSRSRSSAGEMSSAFGREE